MTYKALNTVIDDLFAFVITMPVLHRLSVFRDDIIFLIFLYQRWIYREDRMRTNEFGVSGVDMDEFAKRNQGAAAAGPVVTGADGAGGESSVGRDEERKEVEVEGNVADKSGLGEKKDTSDLRQRRVVAGTASTTPSS